MSPTSSDRASISRACGSVRRIVAAGVGEGGRAGGEEFGGFFASRSLLRLSCFCLFLLFTPPRPVENARGRPRRFSDSLTKRATLETLYCRHARTLVRARNKTRNQDRPGLRYLARSSGARKRRGSTGAAHQETHAGPCAYVRARTRVGEKRKRKPPRSRSFSRAPIRVYMYERPHARADIAFVCVCCARD